MLGRITNNSEKKKKLNILLDIKKKKKISTIRCLHEKILYWYLFRAYL